MTLGGVALAGATLGLAGKVGPDGILYALETADLNLEGTELVTLSACDTGQGAVDRSEGVYGLVRAFQIAGARDVLMTLWPLSDPLARAFMEDFSSPLVRPRGQPRPGGRAACHPDRLDQGAGYLQARPEVLGALCVLVERR